MVAAKYSPDTGLSQIGMTPDMTRLTVLQLDTGFPRIAGDVASPESYLEPVDIRIIPRASVDAVVSSHPHRLDISGFEAARATLNEAGNEGIIATSCGFLFYWQEHLSSLIERPTGRHLITSSLCCLEAVCRKYGSSKVAIITFDADVLASPLYARLTGDFDGPIIGLAPHHHLRQVISGDLPKLDSRRAEKELLAHLSGKLSGIDAVILECTNLVPYKPAVIKAFGVAIFDIMTCIDDLVPGLVKPAFI